MTFSSLLSIRSHPMRVRGLKHKNLSENHRNQYLVAPHAGAWIETLFWGFKLENDLVAPHAGAWIETSEYLSFLIGAQVAPHAGAWIETVECRTNLLTY